VIDEVVHLDANELATHAIDLQRPVAGPAHAGRSLEAEDVTLG
jgi:nitrite reductase (NADH) small subunit